MISNLNRREKHTIFLAEYQSRIFGRFTPESESVPCLREPCEMVTSDEEPSARARPVLIRVRKFFE